MKCNNCGNNNRDGSKFCSICAFPIAQSELLNKPPVTNVSQQITSSVSRGSSAIVPEKEKQPERGVKALQKNQSYSSRVMERGRVTIPRQIRDALNLKEGDYIVFGIKEDTITVVRSRKNNEEKKSQT